jgi:hypothetical protein
MMQWAYWWKWVARLYRKRYFRATSEAANAWDEVARLKEIVFDHQDTISSLEEERDSLKLWIKSRIG